MSSDEKPNLNVRIDARNEDPHVILLDEYLKPAIVIRPTGIWLSPTISFDDATKLFVARINEIFGKKEK